MDAVEVTITGGVAVTISSPVTAVSPASTTVTVDAITTGVTVSTDGTPAAIEVEQAGPQGIPGPPYDPYNFITKTEDADFRYYGFARETGWMIRRKDKTTGIWTVARGSGEVDQAWTDRANKVYGYV